jgi:hypothetical protein
MIPKVGFRPCPALNEQNFPIRAGFRYSWLTRSAGCHLRPACRALNLHNRLSRRRRPAFLAAVKTALLRTNKTPPPHPPAPENSTTANEDPAKG